MDDNEILYREFWIKATETKLVEMTKDLFHDSRVQDFNRIESDICKSDAERFVNFVDWVLPIIEPLFPVSDTVSLNRIRMMKVARSRLARRLNKT